MNKTISPWLAPGILFTLSSVAASRLTARYGTLVLQGGIVQILATFGLQIIFFTAGTGFWVLFLLQAVYGLGNGLVLPSLLNVTLRSLPAGFAGTAAGVYSIVQQTASALGICLIGGLFFYLLDKTKDIEQAYHYALAALMCCGVLRSIMLFCLPRTVKGNKTAHIAE